MLREICNRNRACNRSMDQSIDRSALDIATEPNQIDFSRSRSLCRRRQLTLLYIYIYMSQTPCNTYNNVYILSQNEITQFHAKLTKYHTKHPMITVILGILLKFSPLIFFRFVIVYLIFERLLQKYNITDFVSIIFVMYQCVLIFSLLGF